MKLVHYLLVIGTRRHILEKVKKHELIISVTFHSDLPCPKDKKKDVYLQENDNLGYTAFLVISIISPIILFPTEWFKHRTQYFATTEKQDFKIFVKLGDQ